MKLKQLLKNALINIFGEPLDKDHQKLLSSLNFKKYKNAFYYEDIHDTIISSMT
jgi:hypothetical protein